MQDDDEFADDRALVRLPKLSYFCLRPECSSRIASRGEVPKVFSSWQDELRRQRLEQLRSLAKENRFGNVRAPRRDNAVPPGRASCRWYSPPSNSFSVVQVKGITRSEFISEVSEASKEIWVVVALYSDSVEESRTFVACLDVLAPRHPAVKFIKMIGTDCIPDYPESNLPTVLLYHEGEMKHRIVGVRPFGGRGKLSPDSIEWVLHRAGVVHTELEEDPRGEDQDDGWGRAGRTWQVTRSADDLE